MAEVTAALVKQLREKTGAGMMDCKKALADTEGDLEAAVDWLRKKGLSQARKKAGRATAEGLVAVATDGPKGAMVEVNAETDFVARNETFQTFAQTVAKVALDTDGSEDAVKAASYPGTGRTVADELTQLIGTIGENMKLGRSTRIDVGEGAVAGYVHNQMSPGLGKLGVLVGLRSSGDAAKLDGLAKQIAMHIAASNPNAISQEDIDPALIQREREVLEEQARASGKPENIIEKMVEGRLRKFYEEVALLDQVFVVDGENKVRTVVENLASELGTEVQVADFKRFELGEQESSGDDAGAEAA
jgi:elongation factor Ts